MGFLKALLGARDVRGLITAPVLGRGELTKTAVIGLKGGECGGVGGRDNGRVDKTLE